jgi:hypothetical protein
VKALFDIWSRDLGREVVAETCMISSLTPRYDVPWWRMTMMRNSQVNEQTLTLGSPPCQTWITSGRRTRCSVDRMERSSQVLDVPSLLPTTSVELGTTACWRGVLENASSSSKVEQVVDESESSIFYLLDFGDVACDNAGRSKSELLTPL